MVNLYFSRERASIFMIADSFEFAPMSKRSDEDAEARENTGDDPEAMQENRPNRKNFKMTKSEIDPDNIPF